MRHLLYIYICIFLYKYGIFGIIIILFFIFNNSKYFMLTMYLIRLSNIFKISSQNPKEALCNLYPLSQHKTLLHQRLWLLSPLTNRSNLSALEWSWLDEWRDSQTMPKRRGHCFQMDEVDSSYATGQWEPWYSL